MPLSPRKQRRQIAKVERYDATLAQKEGLGNLHNAQRNFRKGNTILGRQECTEAQWDFQWAAKRRRIANRNVLGRR